MCVFESVSFNGAICFYGNVLCILVIGGCVTLDLENFEKSPNFFPFGGGMVRGEGGRGKGGAGGEMSETL